MQKRRIYMTIPVFNTCMLPALEFAADKKEHSNQELVAFLSDFFKLSEDERNEKLPSGTKTRIYDRASWAKTYLKRAKLIEITSQSKFVITARGEAVLKEKLPSITVKYLEKFGEFKEYLKTFNIDKTVEEVEEGHTSPKSMTPQEAIDFGYQKLNENISVDLLDQIKKCTPDFFENLVVQLIVKMGYGGSLKEAGQVVGKSGDGGIDGLIKEDRLGLDIVYIQAKRWDVGQVGRPEIQKFVGALAGKKSKKGIFITTSGFTKEAMDYARNIDSNIVLIDGKKLTDLMIEFNLGVSVQQVVEIKQIDFDFFA